LNFGEECSVSRPVTKRRLAAVLAADVVGYSRLMGEDEAATLTALQQAFRNVVEPAVRSYDGQIVKSMGDGYLVEFSSASDAIGCATKWQSRLHETRSKEGSEVSLQFRIGINLGEIVSDGGDIYGDGVNIAARLETLSPPGGICVSEMIKGAVGSQAHIQFEDIGIHRLKNIKTPIQAFLVSMNRTEEEGRAVDFGLEDQSEIRYCLSKDGTSLAYAQVGVGYPLVFAGSWMSHLELDWESPSYRDYLAHLTRHFTVIRYDQRGNGMSDWDDVDIAFDKMVDDMECVIEQYDHERVAILGMSQGASVSLAYAKRHPQKVSHLVLSGGYARGRRRRGSDKDNAESEALVNMVRHGWAAENPAFRQAVTTLFMPDATPEEADWFNDFQKACGPGENMARFREMFDEMDVSGLLEEITVPTLIVHSDEDAIAPLSEAKFMASRIPGARFIKLKSKNHMMFGNEPDFPKLIESIVEFVK
jgi:class 3 adenylate cyclase/pimeloyl-ACP methyl ester carboxylesterase